MSDETPAGRRGIFWNGTAIALLACTALVLLAAPVFPSEDGPVHLYYADVLRGVLAHSPPYSQHFAVKAWLTPYALEDYALVGLETIFSAAMSEKVLICCYIFLFGLGFRYLVESVAERASPWTLAGIPFCMHMMVYLGFLNYCLGVALLLFQCGFWIRYSGRLQGRRLAALLAGLLLMLLTHPVPVAVFLVFAGLYVVADLAREAAAGSGSWMPALRARIRVLALLAAMGAVALFWVGMFMDRTGSTPTASYVSGFGWAQTLTLEVELLVVTPFRSLTYRAGPLLLLAMAFVTLFQNPWKQGRGYRSAPVALVATSSLCFLLFCIVPVRFNTAWFFAERFPILWVLFLLAAAAALRPPRWWSVTVGGVALAITACVLALQWQQVSRIGNQIAPALKFPAAEAGSAGLITGPPKNLPEGLSFDPYMWSGVHYFRNSRAILENAPWMEQTYQILRLTHPSRWSYLDPGDASEAIMGAMVGGTAPRDLDFVARVGPYDLDIDGAMNRMGWSDSTGHSEFLRVYRRQR